MKINPISIVSWPHYDHMIKRIYEKNEATGAIKVVEERYPIYNNLGKIIETFKLGNKIDIKV